MAFPKLQRLLLRAQSFISRERHGTKMLKSRDGGMVDTRDLKSLGQEWLCGFESRSRHKRKAFTPACTGKAGDKNMQTARKARPLATAKQPQKWKTNIFYREKT